MSRGNPSIATRSIELDPEEIRRIEAQLDGAEMDRHEWVENQRKLTEQRFCITNRSRNVPWPGANNIRLPIQDKAIKRWSSRILSLVFDASPIAYFRALEPGDVESARLVEQFYDWLFRIKMSESVQELTHLVDIVAHRGFGFVHVFWDYRVENETRVLEVRDLFPQGVDALDDAQIAQIIQDEYDTDEVPRSVIDEIRAGKEFVTLEFETVVADRPRIAARDPLQVLAPATATSVEDAAWIAIEHLVDSDFLRDGVRSRGFDPVAVDECLGADRGGSMTQRIVEQQVFDRVSGAKTQEEIGEKHRIFEIYTWHDDGRERYRVVVWYHAGAKRVLAAHPFVYPFHRWPLVRFDFERTCNRSWYGSRGLSHKLSGLVRSINRIHNARHDAIDIELAPTFKARGMTAVKGIQYGPGRIIPVGEMDELQPLVHDLRNLQAYLSEEFHLRNLAEDYAGTLDASVYQAMRPSERRTATEVSVVSEQIQGILSLDAKLFQATMAELHRLVWQLWYEFGAEDVFYRVMNEEQPILFRKSEVARDYDIVPAGTLANTSKAIEMARAREALQLLAADQSGIIDRAELFRWYLGLLDWSLAKRIIRGPEEQQAFTTLMQAANEIATGQLGSILQQAQSAAMAQSMDQFGSVQSPAPPLQEQSNEVSP